MTPPMVIVKKELWLFAPNFEHTERENGTSLRIRQTEKNEVMTRWQLMGVIEEVT